jgi:hypothetical protein
MSVCMYIYIYVVLQAIALQGLLIIGFMRLDCRHPVGLLGQGIKGSTYHKGSAYMGQHGPTGGTDVHLCLKWD